MRRNNIAKRLLALVMTLTMVVTMVTPAFASSGSITDGNHASVTKVDVDIAAGRGTIAVTLTGAQTERAILVGNASNMDFSAASSADTVVSVDDGGDYEIGVDGCYGFTPKIAAGGNTLTVAVNVPEADYQTSGITLSVYAYHSGNTNAETPTVVNLDTTGNFVAAYSAAVTTDFADTVIYNGTSQTSDATVTITNRSGASSTVAGVTFEATAGKTDSSAKFSSSGTPTIADGATGTVTATLTETNAGTYYATAVITDGTNTAKVPLEATIGKATIDLSGLDLTVKKTYDGDADDVSVVVETATIAGENSKNLAVAVSGTPTVSFTDVNTPQNVGTGKTYEVTGAMFTFSDGTDDMDNYVTPTATDTQTLTNGEIEAKDITIAPDDASFTIMKNEATNLATKAGWTVTGLVTGESLTLDTDYELSYNVTDAKSSGLDINGVDTTHTDTATAAATGATIAVTPSLKNTTKANNYNLTSSAATLTIDVSEGTAVAATGDALDIVLVDDSSANTSDITSTQIATAFANVVVKESPSGTTPLAGAWTTPAGALTSGENTVTFTWTGEDGAGNPYATTTKTAKVYVKKQLTVGDFTTSTITKKYDNTAAMPTDGKEVVKLTAPVNDSGNIDLFITIAGTYDDVNVGAGNKAITVTGVTKTDAGTHADWADYYLLPLAPFAGITNAAITQGDAPDLTLGNLSQTTGSVTAVTVTADPTSTDFAGVVEYKVPLALTYTVSAANCNCGAAETGAHDFGCPAVACTCGAAAGTPAATKHDAGCAYTGNSAGTCDCTKSLAGTENQAHTNGCPVVDCTCAGVAAGVAIGTKHETGCAYGGNVPDHAQDCDCSFRATLATAADHTAGCAAVVANAQTYEWKKFGDAPTDSTLGLTVSAWLNSLPAGTNVDVRATSTASTNLAAQTAPVSGTLAIQAAYVPPTGGGVSSYTVKYDVGTHGKLAEGAKASESVSYNKSPKSVPQVVANEGWKFLGWSLDGKAVVDPMGEKITKSTTFTALYEGASHTPYIIGIGDGRFAPEGQMTRAEAVTMLARLHPDWKGVGAENLFNDVADDAWYAPYVTFATAKGITEGVGDDLFAPERAITRGEMAALLVRYMGLNTDGLSGGFTDTLGNWADRYVTALKNAGVADGYGDGTFKPDAGINRSEAVKLINGAVGRAPDKELVKLNTKTNPFIDVPESHWAFADVMEAALEHHISDYHTQSDK